MKWFRHQSNAHKGELLQELYVEFGVHVGYSLYFRLVEYLTDKWDGVSEPKFKISELELRRFLGITRKLLIRFSFVIDLQTDYEFKVSEKFVEIRFPKLLEILHRDALSSGHRPANVRPTPGLEEKRREENREEVRVTAPPPLESSTDGEDLGPVRGLQGNLFLDQVLPTIPKAVQRNWLELYDHAWLKLTLIKAIEHHMAKRNASTPVDVVEWQRKLSAWLSTERTPKLKPKPSPPRPIEHATPWPTGAKERALGDVSAVKAMGKIAAAK